MKTICGFTLLEVIIAVALFSTLLVAVIETSIGILNYTDQHQRLLELEEEGRQILKQMSADLSNSGPYVEPGNLSYPLATPINKNTNPYGNSIRFLRINSTSSSADNGVELFNFSDPITTMSKWATPSNTIKGLVVNPNYSLNAGELVSPIWEKNSTFQNQASSSSIPYWTANRNLSNLRIYSYEVVPLPNLAYGTLQRKYSVDGGITYQKDTSIPDLGRGHVYSFVIEPAAQGVRLHLELISQNARSSGEVRRTFDSVITMLTQ
jgi:prepilin-type N-terminal cleavage/methylation domain-containing protein